MPVTTWRGDRRVSIDRGARRAGRGRRVGTADEVAQAILPASSPTLTENRQTPLRISSEGGHQAPLKDDGLGNAPPPGLMTGLVTPISNDRPAGGGLTRVDEYLCDVNQVELGLKCRGGQKGVEAKGLVAVTWVVARWVHLWGL